MKTTIAHVRGQYLGLSETFIYTVLTELRRYRVILLAHEVSNTDLFPLPNLRAVPQHRWHPLRVARGLARRLRRQGDLYYEYVLRRERARLIHAHFGPEGVDLLPLKWRLRVPLVTTFYGYDMSQLGRQAVWRRAYASLFKNAELILVEGPHMRQGLLGLGCPADKVCIQPISIVASRYSYAQRHLPAEGPVRMLFCGRFVEKKGLSFALQALAAVVKDFPQIEFRIVGDGELREEVTRQISELALEPYVVRLGYRSHAEVIAEMKQAHILIQPSVTASNGDSEGGAPTILLEAQASGLPILATDHADIPFVVGDGAGLLAPERDSTKLAANLGAMLAAPDRWAEMGRRGRQHVQQAHDIGVTIPMLEEQYARLLRDSLHD